MKGLLLTVVVLVGFWAICVGQERTERLERDQMRLELLRELEAR